MKNSKQEYTCMYECYIGLIIIISINFIYLKEIYPYGFCGN